MIVAPASYALFGWDTWSAYWARLTTVDTFFNVRGPVDITIYWGILLGTYLRTYYRRYQEKSLKASQLEAQLTRARLAILNSRLQPHFIFNTLHSIVALIRRDDKEGAVGVTVGLSDMLRLILRESDRQEITLREEIGITKQYLTIEQLRFGDRLAVEIKIDSEAEGAYVPTLILQPLVENAIRHGIGETVGPGIIRIDAARCRERLKITVTDNGVGVINSVIAGTEGLGLRITRDRLRDMYGSDWEFSLKPLTGERGTEALMELPFLTKPKFPAAEG